MQHRASVFAWLFAAGCSVGAPPGFSGGDRWTLPLVGPLEDGILVTPVSVHGHGPYLFAIDPDANVSAIDKDLAQEAGLRIGNGPHVIDETDTGQTRLYAEMLDLRVAGLAIDRRDVLVFPVGFYDTEIRHLRGVLGHDVIADSLVFGFDRDQGIATLSTVEAFKAPPDAIAIRYQTVSSQGAGAPPVIQPGYDHNHGLGLVSEPGGGPTPADLTPIPRRLASAQIGGATFVMHLDLGAATSQLTDAKWQRAGLSSGDAQLRLVDEAVTARQVTRAAMAPEVMVSGARASQVTFAPYIEKRFGLAEIDGALGLDFFRPYAVYASWDSKTVFLKPRGDAAATIAARIGRWGAAIPTCPHPGCVTASPGADGATLEVVRDAEAAGRALEVFVAATPAGGASAPPLVVELPASATKVTGALPPAYAGAAFAVLDVAPFSRGCPGDSGCVLQVGAAGAAAAAPGPPGAGRPAVPGEPASRNVPFDKLRRVSGESTVPPSDDVKRAAGKPIAVAIVKLCLDADGKVVSIKIVKTSGVAAYDDQLRAAITATWTFAPVEVDGKPAPVCTTVTFAQH